MRMLSIAPVLVMLTCSFLSVTGLSAQAGNQPVLKIHNSADQSILFHEFDMEDLMALGETSFVTSTIWTEEDVEFSGVTITALLDRLEITDGMVEIFAANDYFVEIPVADLRDSPALIAYHMNGEPMSTRDKGPFWLVYPYDSDMKYQSETYYSRSIWQIDRFNFLP